MASAARPVSAPVLSSWHVTRDGVTVADVVLRREVGGVAVTASIAGGSRLHRFDSLQAADTFVGDLIPSFCYLGCDVIAG